MKKVLVSIITMIFIISMAITVKAATGNISFGASSDSVLKGKTFTITLAGTADGNITGLKADLSYDTSKLKIDNKKAGTGFSDLSGSKEISIVSTNSENLSKSGTLYTITFKVLDNAAEGATEISISNVTLALVNENSQQENVNVANDSVIVTIKADDTTAGNNEDNNNNTNNGNNNNNTDNGANNNSSNTNNNNSGKSNSNSNKSNNSNTKKLPQTGIEDVNILLVIALGAIALASYVSYRKYKNI